MGGLSWGGESLEKVGEKVDRKLGGSWGDSLGECSEKVGDEKFKLGKRLENFGSL